MQQYIESLYNLPGVTRVYSPFAGPASLAECSMGSFGPDVWIECDQCGWGAWGGKDHIHIDGMQLILLCQWCFEVPDPPFWINNQVSSRLPNQEDNQVSARLLNHVYGRIIAPEPIVGNIQGCPRTHRGANF